MPAEPLVSVIVPAHNATAVLGEALESVRSQTYTHLEAIVVDDGSTDRTPELASMLVRADRRFQLLRQVRSGASGARNAALREASGAWVAFLDADDVWFPDKLAAQLALADATPEANFLFSNYVFWDGQRELGLRYARRKQFPARDVRAKLARWNVFGSSSVVVTRRLLDAAGTFDEGLRHSQDWDLWLRMAEAGMRACGLTRPLLRYRLWEGNMSRDAVAEAECDVRLLEKAATRASEGRWRRCYQRSACKARGKLELARLRATGQPTPEALRAALWRAWRAYPRRLKWLFRCGLAWSPGWLTGARWRNRLHAAIGR